MVGWRDTVVSAACRACVCVCVVVGGGGGGHVRSRVSSVL